MENSSYALYIAIGTLIAIVVLSFLLFNWRKIGSLESTKDDVIAVKNKADFNKEFEVYNKSLMYGTDVLSCLNKAQNNNQKYVYSNYYGTDMETVGKADRTEYFIDVEVVLYSPLYDRIKAYYKDKNGKYKQVIGLNASDAVNKNYKKKVFKDDGTKNTFDDPVVYYYYFKKGLVYQESRKYTDIMWSPGKADALTLGNVLTNSGQIQTLIDGNDAGISYHLLQAEDKKTSVTSPNSITQAAKLSALITTVSLKEQRLVNSESPTSYNQDDWWYCTWTTAASDFKSRKFKCIGSDGVSSGVTYNVDTGYIEKLRFVEVKAK